MPNDRSAERPSALDELDRKIIGMLQKNGRQNNSEIARCLGVTETTIRNRVARLLREDLLNIVAVPTPKAVGLSLSAIIGVSVTLSRLDEIAQALAERPEARYVGLSTGRYDIMIEAFFQSNQHLLHFLSGVLGAMEGVEGIETSLILDVVKFSYEWEVP